MKRLSFIKSLGLIAIAPTVIINALKGRTPVEEIELKALEPSEPLPMKWRSVPGHKPYQVRWRLNEIYHQWEATVKGQDKKTGELKIVPMVVPEAEIAYYGDDIAMKEKMVALARQMLIDEGCVPL